MSKKNLRLFFVVVFCLVVDIWMVSSCQKVVLPVEEDGLENIEGNDEDVSENGESTDDEVGNESGLGINSDEDSFSVGALIAAGDSMKGTFCIVKGYVVGYTTRTMKNTVFSSEGAVRTNVVIADSPKETDYQNCIPVELKDEDVRQDLSLADHPEKLGCRAKFYGIVDTYFYVVGVRDIQYGTWLQDGDDGNMSENEDGDGSDDNFDEESDGGDISEDSSSDDVISFPDGEQVDSSVMLDTLIIDTSGVVVPGGRTLLEPK